MLNLSPSVCWPSCSCSRRDAAAPTFYFALFLLLELPMPCHQGCVPLSWGLGVAGHPVKGWVLLGAGSQERCSLNPSAGRQLRLMPWVAQQGSAAGKVSGAL